MSFFPGTIFPDLSFTSSECLLVSIATSKTVPFSETIIIPFLEYLPKLISISLTCNEWISSLSKLVSNNLSTAPKSFEGIILAPFSGPLCPDLAYIPILFSTYLGSPIFFVSFPPTLTIVVFPALVWVPEFAIFNWLPIIAFALISPWYIPTPESLQRSFLLSASACTILPKSLPRGAS